MFDMSNEPNTKSTQTHRNPPRGPGKYGKEIKEAIYRAFHNPAVGADKYLVKLANENPAVFCGLLGKIVPAELVVSGSVLVDIGQAMIDAEQRQKLHNDTTAPMIDITPEPKVLETKDK